MAFFGKDITAADLAVGNLQGSEKEASEFGKALRFGLDQPTENVATTLKALGFDTQADSLSGLVDAPENYESAAARFMNPEGEGLLDFNYKNLPLAIVEQAGQLGGSMLSRAGGLALAGPVGALLGPALFEAVQIAGPVALERARNNGREEPNWEDWSGALGTSAFSGALNAVGVQGIGRLNSTIAGSALREGVTEGLQGATEQIGSTGLTEAGLQIDPKQIIGEGLIGGSTGASAQVPSSAISTEQSLENLRQDIIGDSITNTMFDQTTPEQAVEEMGEQLMLTEQTVANIEQFEQEADQYDPDDPGAFTDEDIIQEFLTTNDQYLENQIETQFGDQLTRDEQFQLFVNVQEYVRSHFEFFDPRAENTPRDALRQIANTVTQEAGAFLDAANLEKIEAGVDPRYVGPQSMDINLNAKEELYATQPPVPNINMTNRQGITSIESGIDPNFLTQSILMQDGILDQRLPKDPNKPVNPQSLLQELGVKETDKNWFETSKRGNKKVVSELVNTEIAPFLKAKRDAGEKVTRAEIESIFYDSLNRHKSFYTTGRGTQHEGEHTFKEQGLADLFPEVSLADQYFELWNHYDPLIPSNSTLENSPFFNRDGNDNLHSPHGDGALMWTRGFQVEHPDGSGPGTLLAENQSKLHGHSQDPGKPNKMYLSSTGIEEDASQFDAIKKRQADYNSAVIAFVAEQTEKITSSTILPDLLLEEPSQYGQYRDVVLTPIEQELSSISDTFKNENKFLKEKQIKESNDAFVEAIVESQPLGNLGITIDKDSFQEFMDQPAQALDVFETLGKQRRNRFNEYVLLNHGFNLRLESVTNRNYDQRTFKPINDTIINLAERPDGELGNKHTADRVELILDYSPKFAEKYSTFNNLVTASDNYPTATEMRELEEYEARMRDTNKVIFPDYPFKNNYPAMNLRKTITLALDQGNSYIFIGSKGSGGAPPSVYKAQRKEAEGLAEAIASYRSDLKANDLFKVLPESEDVPGGPYYALDIRPLKQLIEAKVFKGFKGYKEGGLVMNYGDYGRSYI